MVAVYAESPSAASEPTAAVTLGSALVVWRPERGWLCSQHAVQPCTHTANLSTAPSPRWRQ